MIDKKQCELGKKLKGIGRILQEKNYFIWGCSPIYDEEGHVHVFYSRWKKKYKSIGWVAACEIAHAVADTPQGPYRHIGVVLKGRKEDTWDSWSIHNPSICKVDDKYVLLYMGSDGSKLDKTLDEIIKLDEEDRLKYYRKLVNTKRVGMAISDNLNEPFTRISDEKPLIDIGNSNDWDSYCTSNPTFIKTPEGKYRIYYKAWSIETARKFHGNRKYGFAESDTLLGEYIKYKGNPVIDYSYIDERVQAEDGFIWYQNDEYHMFLRDMGVFNHQYGLYVHSKDGINWSNPMISFLDASHYFDEGLPELPGEGRFERPQILMKNKTPEYLFCAYRGGLYNTSSGVVFKFIN